MPDKHIVAYFARHGTTQLNAKNCFRGPEDVALDNKGYRDAHALAFYFKPIELLTIVSSDKQRAFNTAKIIGQEKAVEPIANPDLHAWNVGYLAGKPKDEHEDEIKFYADHPNTEIPEGESLNEFRARIQPLISSAIHLGIKHGVPPLVVAHSSVIHEVGAMINQNHESSLVHPGGVVAVYIYKGVFHAEPIFKALQATKTSDSIS